MQIQVIRNATLRIIYRNRVFITDPSFAPKHSQEPLIGKSRNPTADLPFSTEDILANVEMVLISHLHPDHFDNTAQQLLTNIIITHSSGASLETGNPIIMDGQQTMEVCRAAPQSIIIAIHTETFDFDTISRKGLRAMAETEGIKAKQLLIPADGETLVF